MEPRRCSFGCIPSATAAQRFSLNRGVPFDRAAEPNPLGCILLSTESPRACSECFRDLGLRMDAAKLGSESGNACSRCNSVAGSKLSERQLGALAYRFFVQGSLHRFEFGGAPIVQFNEHQETSVNMSEALTSDIRVFEQVLGVGFFRYGPPLWMLGEIEQLAALRSERERDRAIDEIFSDYRTAELLADEQFFRLRVGPAQSEAEHEYDSPPDRLCGRGRLDSPNLPVMYGSQDLEVCIHECRVSAEDDLFLATLKATRALTLLDLTQFAGEESGSAFQSLDLAVHFLFLASDHSYEATRAIARAARDRGLDGLVYPSYFSLLRTGAVPFETSFGMPHRMLASHRRREQRKIVRNLALFGRPLASGLVELSCINRLLLRRVEYRYGFGPVGID